MELIEGRYRYFAFISYKREDEKWAKWLQQKLEHYKLPSNLNGRTDLPREIRPVFKDTSELTPGNLPQQIRNALEQSKYLIVVCSPRSAHSEWVNKEVETFVEMGRTDKIIPFIIEAKAFSKDPEEECFPEALRSLPTEQEILGANISEMGRDAAVIKVVARMFDVKFDTLWHRHEREKRKRRNWTIAGSCVAALIVVAVAGWIWSQSKQVKEKKWQKMEEQSRSVAKTANILVDNGDSFTALRLLLEVLPQNLSDPDRPFVSEAENALRYALMHNTFIIKKNNYAIHSVSYSPDGHRLASASEDGSVIIWDADTGEQLWEGKEQSGKAYSVCFSPDGRRIMAETFMFGENTTWIWNTEDGALQQRLEGVSCASFSPDSKRIVALSTDTVIVWDLETESLLKTFEKDVNSVDFSSDGNHIVSGLQDNRILIWDVTTGRTLKTLDGHSDIINSIELNSDGSLIVTASQDGTIKIWDERTGDLMQTFSDLSKKLSSACFSPDGQLVVSAFSDGSLKIWDVKTGALLQTLNGHTDWVSSVGFHPSGHQIVSSSEDGTIRTWDLGTDHQPTTFGSHTLSFKDAACSYDGNRVVVSADSIIIWDVCTRRKTLAFANDSLNISTVALNSSGNRIATSSDGLIRIWDANTFEPLVTMNNGQADSDNIVSIDDICFSPDGSRIVTASWNTLQIWDVNTGNLIQSMDGHSDNVNSVNYNYKGNLIISTSAQWDGTIRIWDADSGNQLHELIKNAESASFACLSPDDKYVVSVSDDNEIRLWDIDTKSQTRTLQGHTGVVNYASFSPDGQYVVSGSDDGCVMVWSTKTGVLLQTFSGNEYTVMYAAFLSDGQHILAILSDGTIRIWEFPSLQELIDQTRERFKNRPLTPEERRQYYLE